MLDDDDDDLTKMAALLLVLEEERKEGKLRFIIVCNGFLSGSHGKWSLLALRLSIFRVGEDVLLLAIEDNVFLACNNLEHTK